MSPTTVTMDTQVTGHKTRAITILKGKQQNYDKLIFRLNDLQLNKILMTFPLNDLDLYDFMFYYLDFDHFKCDDLDMNAPIFYQNIVDMIKLIQLPYHQNEIYFDSTICRKQFYFVLLYDLELDDPDFDLTDLSL